MVLVASSIQTARIRHGDKGSPCRRMSNALTDESEILSVFSCSFSLWRALLSLHLFPTSFSPSLSLLSLSFRGCQSVFSITPPSLSSYSPPSFSSCQMFFCSPFQSISLFPFSFYSLAIFVCVSLSMYSMYPST